MRYPRFTPEEDNFIRDNYLKYPSTQIANMLGRSKFGVFNRLRILGINVPDEIKKKFIKESKYVKGQEPFNKGLRQVQYMSEDSIEKSIHTRFKKGLAPHNAKHDGAISIRKDSKSNRFRKYIRVKKNKWVELSRYNWENKNGPLKKGEIIRFKDGDSMNCELDNLIKIDRAENAKLNSWTLKLTDKYVAFLIDRKNSSMVNNKELIEIKRQQIILNRIINERRRDN